MGEKAEVGKPYEIVDTVYHHDCDNGGVKLKSGKRPTLESCLDWCWEEKARGLTDVEYTDNHEKGCWCRKGCVYRADKRYNTYTVKANPEFSNILENKN